MKLPTGTLLQGGKYRIERVLGQGGFGITYLATHTTLGSLVAIKEFFIKGVNERDADCTTVSVSNADNKEQFEQQRNKFLKEARRLSQLRNKHIVLVHDLFEDNGTAYYVMDFIEGQSLRNMIDQKGKLEEELAWNCLNQMLEALEEIHSSNIWHLDIKPANIMLDSNGSFTLIDFGASKMVSDGNSTINTSIITAYTPGYAPIEQVSQKIESYGPWTDFYALGASLYCVITGSAPPLSDEIVEKGNHVFNFPENTDARLSHLIMWMMQANRNNRPQSVAEIRQYLNGEDTVKVQQSVAVIHKSYDSVAKSDYASKDSNLSIKKWRWPLVALLLCLFLAGSYYGYKIYKKSQIDYTTYNLDLVAAAEDGDADAQVALADCYYFAYGVKFDLKKAFEWYQKAAEQVNPIGLFGLGNCYYHGAGIDRDTIKALEYFSQASEMLLKMTDSDNAEVLLLIGVCYSDGYGVEKNDDRAISYYRKAVNLGSRNAKVKLGNSYFYGEGVKKDAEEAVKWYRKAAEQGSADGQFNLGLCYDNGYGVKKDGEEAVKWYRKAAEQGSADAQCNLGACYEDGVGVEKNAEEAVKWYRKAAEQGDARAQRNLGWCYEDGIGVKKDAEEAVKWYRKAAEQGYAPAQFSLGVSYVNGKGVKKDAEEGVKWYRKAAEQGDADAQNNLGACYYDGIGLAKDRNEAIRWFQKSARQGDKLAQQNLRNLGESW